MVRFPAMLFDILELELLLMEELDIEGGLGGTMLYPP